MINQDTICALTSGNGGAISVIRVSGSNAIELVDSFYVSPKKGKKLDGQPENTTHYGSFTVKNEIIDDVMVALFLAPRSYTGENVVEISCHGSTYIQQEILRALISNGARMAKPGEFTQRAFLNGKMDLSQAEAVADLIASTTKASQKIAISQMRGGFSAELSNLRSQLLHFIALIELELDFSEEDVEFADRLQLKQLLSNIDGVIRKLTNSFQLGNAIKNGIPVAIIGETNVGKSTLLNALLNEERAIVSDIHGTTRDVIEDVINIHGTAFRFFDTAGIRETSDEIETLGIERSYNKLDLATIVILVVDLTNSFELISDRITKIRSRIVDQHLIIAANKIDKAPVDTVQKLDEFQLNSNEKLIKIAAKQKVNLSELISAMQTAVSFDNVDEDAIIVTNLRHYEALSKALQAVERVELGIENLSGEFLAQDMRECLHYLGEITGEISTDEILGHIFKHFCIGK